MTLAPVAALVAALGLVVGATAATGTHAKTNAGGTLTWAIQTNPASLFDAYYFSAEGSQIFSLVQDHILAPGTFGQPTIGEGAVASAWKAVNPTTYTYTIKTGVKFSDGSTLSAKDVAFSMNIHRDPKTGSKMSDFFGNVRSITSKGNVVTVQLVKPDSNWQYTPAASPGLVYSRADFLRKGQNFGTPSGMPIGTGPYMFTSFEPNSRVVLKRNPYYKGKKYQWDTIVFPLIPDEQARLLALQSGQIDGTFAVPNNSISTWVKASGMRVGTYVSGGWRGFSLDTEDGPFQDIHVRRAIAYSLDKVGINEALTSSRGKVLAGLPPLIFLKALLPAKEINAALKKVAAYPYSVANAKAELGSRRTPTASDDPERSDRLSCVSAALADSVSGRSEDRNQHQPEHHAGAAAVPGDPGPQSASRDSGSRAGA